MRHLALVLSLTFASSAFASPLSDRLGFAPTDKVLIVHADDMGSVPSANKAIQDVLDFGIVRSASLMMPCPAIEEATDFAVTHPEADLGLHVTLTSEWPNYRWGPVADPSTVPSLLDSSGNLRPSLFNLFVFGRKPDAAREMEAQIQKALALGLRPTHIDTHMGSAYLRPSWAYAYMNLGLKYHIPAMLPRWSPELKKEYGTLAGFIMQFFVPSFLNKVERSGFLLLDHLVSVVQPADQTFAARKQIFMDTIRGIQPGVTQIIIHPAYVDHAYQEKILSTNPEQVLREYEAKIFQDPEVRALIEREGIHLIGWREIYNAYPWGQVQPIEN